MKSDKPTLIEHVSEYLPLVLTETNTRFKIFKSVVDYKSLSTKLKSELISNMLEASFSSVAPDTESPFSDNQPDLLIMGMPLEIKTSKTTHVWRGGEYSKRPSNYLLVSYDDNFDDLKWFVLYTELFESDWKSSISKNYYATTIDLNDIVNRKPHQILVGDLLQKRTKKHLICQ